MAQKRILLIVAGGIAAYKSLELVRLLKRQGLAVRAVMTKSANEFVTPLSMGVMTEDQVYGDMFDLKDEREIGHIQLSRQADLVVICPATANILAKMASGIADDLATTVLLATDKPVLAVPAMNVRMWLHAATVRNVAELRASGVAVLYITHDLATAYYISDYVVVMNKGQVVEFGPARAVMNDPQHAYTRLLLDSIPTTRSRWRPRLQRAG